jgi:hypothetical protein
MAPNGQLRHRAMCVFLNTIFRTNLYQIPEGLKHSIRSNEQAGNSRKTGPKPDQKEAAWSGGLAALLVATARRNAGAVYLFDCENAPAPTSASGRKQTVRICSFKHSAPHKRPSATDPWESFDDQRWEWISGIIYRMDWDELAAAKGCFLPPPKTGKHRTLGSRCTTQSLNSVFVAKPGLSRALHPFFEPRHVIRPDQLDVDEWTDFTTDLHTAVRALMAVCEAVMASACSERNLL